MSQNWLHIFIAFLLAHLVTEYIFRPFIKNKVKKDWLFRVILGLTNAALTYVLLTNWNLWYIALGAAIFDLLLEWVISILKQSKFSAFVLDEGIYISALIGLTFWIASIGSTPIWTTWLDPYLWKLSVGICALILLVPSGGLLIDNLMEFIQPQTDEPQSKENESPTKGIKNGGKIIGYLERLLIFTFVITNQFTGIGFLVAAKSIFRFSEISKNEDRKEAEYIIVGTFASFLYAIIISWIALTIMQ